VDGRAALTGEGCFAGFVFARRTRISGIGHAFHQAMISSILPGTEHPHPGIE